VVCYGVFSVDLTACCPFVAEPDSPLKKFIEQSSKMSSEEKAAFLEKDEVRKLCVHLFVGDW